MSVYASAATPQLLINCRYDFYHRSGHRRDTQRPVPQTPLCLPLREEVWVLHGEGAMTISGQGKGSDQPIAAFVARFGGEEKEQAAIGPAAEAVRVGSASSSPGVTA